MSALVHPATPNAVRSQVQVGDGLRRALESIGRHPQAQVHLIAALREMEGLLQSPGRSAREGITGPIVDALMANAGVQTRTLANGVKLRFHYRSKIAREFVMSPQENPDHVWEPQTTRLLLHLAREAKNVFVGGAYMGDHAILMAHQLQSCGGACHAFEPNPDQHEMLCSNARLNHLENLRAYPLALWSLAGETLVLVGDDAEAHGDVVQGFVPNDDDGATFQTTTIDACADAAGIDRIELIMLDIEGAELAALRGAERFLAMAPATAPAIVFEIHSLYSDWSRGLANAEIVRFLRSFGYHVYAVRDHHGNMPMGDRPIEIIPPERTVIAGPPHGFNMLAVKRAEMIDGPPFRMCNDVSPKLLPHKEPVLYGPMGGW